MTEKNTVDYLESVLFGLETDFILELRMNGGYNQEEYEKLFNVLQVCAEEWETLDSLPKRAAHLLVDIHSEIYHYSYNYNDVRIIQATNSVRELIHTCTKETNYIDPRKEEVIGNFVHYITKDNNLIQKLENGQGFDEHEFNEIYNELDRISDEINRWKEYPEKLVNSLIDFYEVGLFFYKYKDELNNYFEADKIAEASDKIEELIIGITG